MTVYSMTRGAAGPGELHEGVHYQEVSARGFIRILNQFQWLFSARRPLFASPIYYLAYAVKVAAVLRRRPCDVVHIHTFSQFAPIIRAFNPTTKIIVHMHVEWLSQLDRAMIARRLRHVDLIIGCSEYITAGIRRAFPQLADRCHTVHNGADLDRFAPPTRPPPDAGGTKRIVYAGRVSPEKGVHVLVDAFHEIARQRKDAQLDIIGPEAVAGREFIVALSEDEKIKELASFQVGSYLSQLRARVAPSVAERVSFLGRLVHPQFEEHLQRAHVFAHPAIWADPFPLTVLEAIAVGLPVVAARTGGLPEMIDDEKTGLLVEPGDAPALAEAILRLLEDDSRRQAMGEAARRRAVALFAWDRVAEQMLHEYERLCSDPVADG
jgi:glycosyltransferase involved in cell wall biosynthesis